MVGDIPLWYLQYVNCKARNDKKKITWDYPAIAPAILARTCGLVYKKKNGN